MPAAVASYNLFQLIADVTSKKLLNVLTAISPRTITLTFTKGDTVRGEIRVVYQSGIIATPLIRIYPLEPSGVQLKLTNGIDTVYAIAAGWAYVTTATNGLTDGRLQFDIDVASAALDAAFAAVPNDLFINAFLEISLIIAKQGSPSGNQDEVVIREACQIFKTALTV